MANYVIAQPSGARIRIKDIHHAYEFIEKKKNLGFKSFCEFRVDGVQINLKKHAIGKTVSFTGYVPFPPKKILSNE